MRSLFSASAGVIVLLLSQLATAKADGFVSVSLNERDTASGTALTVAAYAVIFCLLALYAFFVLRRQKKVEKEARDLLARLLEKERRTA